MKKLNKLAICFLRDISFFWPVVFANVFFGSVAIRVIQISCQFRFPLMATLTNLIFKPIRFRKVFSYDSTWNCSLVAENYRSGVVLADECCYACCRSSILNLHTTVTVQTLVFCFFYGNISDWQLTLCSWKLYQLCCLLFRGNCFNSVIFPGNLSLSRRTLFHLFVFLWHVVSLSRQFRPLEHFSQRLCCYFRTSCATFTDNVCHLFK